MRGQRIISGDLIQYKGLWIRKETTDIYVPGQLRQYDAMDVSGKCVLDLGAHIGGYTKKVSEQGAAYCMAVEPVPDNIRLWNMNAAGTNSFLLQGVVLGAGDAVFAGYDFGITQMYISKSDTTGHTAFPTRGRTLLDVSAFTLKYVMQQCVNVDVVKMDIEGAEYAIMYDAAMLFPSYGVKQFAAELHLNRKGYREQALKFVDLFDKTYKQIIPVKIGPKNWNTTGVWELR